MLASLTELTLFVNQPLLPVAEGSPVLTAVELCKKGEKESRLEEIVATQHTTCAEGME